MTFFEWVEFWIDWVIDQIPLVWARITQVWNDFVAFLIETGNKFTIWWNFIIEHVTDQATIIFSHITTVKNDIYTYITIIWEAVIEAIGVAVHNASTALTGVIVGLRNTVVGWVEDVYEYIIREINDVIFNLSSDLSTAILTVKVWARWLLEPINDAITYLFNGVTILIDRPVFFFTEILRMFFLTFLLEEIGHALGTKDATLPPKTNWWNF